MRTWDVPAADDANAMWVGWSAKMPGYFAGTRTPEGDTFSTDGYASLAELTVATAPVVEWSEVDPVVVAEMHAAPSLAFLHDVHASRQEKAIAEVLTRALAS